MDTAHTPDDGIDAQLEELPPGNLQEGRPEPFPEADTDRGEPPPGARLCIQSRTSPR